MGDTLGKPKIEQSFSVFGEILDLHVNISTRNMLISKFKNSTMFYAKMTEDEVRQFHFELGKAIEVFDTYPVGDVID